MKVGKRFAAVRSSLGLTQTEMGQKIGIAREAWRRYEGGSLPNGSILGKIAALGFSVDWLLTGAGTMHLSVQAGAAAIDAVPAAAAPEQAVAESPAGSAAALDGTSERDLPFEFARALETVEGLLHWGSGGYRMALLNARYLCDLIEEKMKEG